MAYRLGIDIGGTFTDAILLNEDTGEMRIGKVPSTPHDPSLGFVQAVERILKENRVATADVRYVVHATTVATNATSGTALTRYIGVAVEPINGSGLTGADAATITYTLTVN